MNNKNRRKSLHITVDGNYFFIKLVNDFNKNY